MHSPLLPPRATRLALCLAAGLLTAACGGSGGDTQIAVKVNKGEISVHQVQAMLQRQPRQLANDPAEQATGRVVELLIDQELAAQAGADAGLDKDPRNVQLLEAARRELIARSYQEQVADRVSRPSSDEIDRYYAGHPELFAQRRLYVLRETAIEPTADAAAVQAVLARAGSLEDFERGLRQARVRFEGRLLAQAAEDLPMTVLGKVAALEAGQSVLVEVPGASRVFTVVQAIAAPVDRHTASAAIATYITNERKAAAVAEAMKKLRADARIEYRGNFAKARSAADAASGARPGAPQ